MGFTSKPVRVIEVPEPVSEPLIAPEREPLRTEREEEAPVTTPALTPPSGTASGGWTPTMRGRVAGCNRPSPRPCGRHSRRSRPNAKPVPGFAWLAPACIGTMNSGFRQSRAAVVGFTPITTSRR